MGAVAKVDGVVYISDNPREIGGITFAAIKDDVGATVDISSQGQSRKYLIYLMVAAISEFSRLFGHAAAMTELQHLIDTQSVVHESEISETQL